MSSDNLSYWNRFADIDPKFTKPITGKAYKGTSPNPQYVIKCLTEMFGPVGQGFGWTVVSEDFTPIGDEIIHWCRIQFWHTDRANVFDSYGQTKALMKTRNGMMSDEDAPKKSLTDAIIKAASHIGIASNIFLGRWDDNKHVAEVNNRFREEERAEQKPAEKPKQSEPEKPAGPPLVDRMITAMEGFITKQQVRDYRNHKHVEKGRDSLNEDDRRKFDQAYNAKFSAARDDVSHQHPPVNGLPADAHEFQ